MYEYEARVVSVYDGDTIHIDCDLGWRDWRHNERVRLAHINAPEMATAEGKAARDWLVKKLASMPTLLTIQTLQDKTEKWGRMLVVILDGTNPPVHEQMVAAGMAVPYEG